MNPINRRKSPRVSYNGLGRIHGRRGNYILPSPYICDIRDTSAQGVCFSTNLCLTVGEEFLIVFHTKCGYKQLELHGIVVRKNDIKPQLWEYGAILFNRDKTESKELAEDVANILARCY